MRQNGKTMEFKYISTCQNLVRPVAHTLNLLFINKCRIYSTQFFVEKPKLGLPMGHLMLHSDKSTHILDFIYSIIVIMFIIVLNILFVSLFIYLLLLLVFIVFLTTNRLVLIYILYILVCWWYCFVQVISL